MTEPTAMLIIREQQLRAFSAALRQRFEDRCVRFVMEEWRREGQTEEDIREEVRALLAAAPDWGFVTERECFRLVNIGAFLGLGFQRSQAHHGLLELLANDSVATEQRLTSCIAYAAQQGTA